MGGTTPSSRAQTLPTAARVRKRREFLRIQGSGRRFPTRHFLVVQAAEPGSPARLGITVTRKIGNAVARNRVKRGVREAFRRRRARLAEGIALVVIARDGTAGLTATAIAEELAPVLARFEAAGAASPASRTPTTQAER